MTKPPLSLPVSHPEYERVRAKLAKADFDGAGRLMREAEQGKGEAPKKRGMNKLETAYSEFLEEEKRLGMICDWRFEAIRFRLADGAWFKPDFYVQASPANVELREVKGFWREAARVRIKIAAELFPWFKFVAVTRKDSMWCYETF